MTIKAYLKPGCGWSNGVRAVLRKYDLPFEEIDIGNSPANLEEMIRRTGQRRFPCIEIDGMILADVSGEEVENFLLANQLVQSSNNPFGLPDRPGCLSGGKDQNTSATTIRFF